MLQNKYMHLMICFLICLGFIKPQAYKISGVILDAKTEEGLNNVSIYIKDKELVNACGCGVSFSLK